MNERELLADCLRRLNRANIAYMLTGSMASNYWGIPRTSHGLDFVIQLPHSAVEALVREFQSDFFLDAAAVLTAFQPPHQFNAIDTRSALKVDFWLRRPAPFEREMFNRRLRIVLFDEPAWICTAEDIVLHKLYWNSLTPSERQLGDATGVIAVQQNNLNLPYLHHWADELGVRSQLEQVLSGRIKPKST